MGKLLGVACLFWCILLVIAVVGLVAANYLVRRRRQQAQPAPKKPVLQPALRRTAPPTSLQKCPTCGAALAVDGVEGMCPQCLLKGVITNAQEAARSANGEHTGAYADGPAPALAELAALLPQLEILELIGQGGMGAVYKARQPSLDRLVAVKVLPPEAGRDPAFAERFNREARALARLGHPNIVGVYEVGHADDLFFIIMEYVDGVNLRQLLRSGHLKPEQALRIIPQICDALQYAHEEGIVHRDVKPENILLDKKGRVKIADFGLAKLLGRDAENFTLTGSRQVMGTLYYMAPEQVERPLEVDHRADIYSLGVVFYEMLTGQLPLGRFPLPSEKAGTDAHLDNIVLHAMEREPGRRYQHASEVKSDVEAPARTPPAVPQEITDDDLEMAKHQVKGPAMGLMVAAVLGMLVWATAIVVIGRLYEWDLHQMEREGVAQCAFLLALSAIGGGLLIAGARKMQRLEWYEFSVITCGLALLPVTLVAWPISAVCGGWGMWMLFKPEVRAAFKEHLQRSFHAG
jgi:tRNA A-37 threonylcarbamoyl transferase component Bud32